METTIPSNNRDMKELKIGLHVIEKYATYYLNGLRLRLNFMMLLNIVFECRKNGLSN